MRVTCDPLHLSYDGLDFQLTAESGHLEWLEEFLRPAFALSAGRVAAARIEVWDDETRYQALLARGEKPGAAPADTFALDSSVIQLPRWNGPDVTLYDEGYRLFYQIDPSRRQIRLVTFPGNRAVRVPLMRVVRELAMNDAHQRRRLLLHASAVRFGRFGIVIAGPKAAGKTTLSSALLRTPGVDYIANDRVLAKLDGPLPSVLGMPSVVTVRPRTLELFPRLRRDLENSAYHARYSIREAESRSPRTAKPWGDGRYGLSPAQWCRLFRVKAVAGAPFSALLFPSITRRSGGAELRRLATRDAAKRLPDALLAAGSWRKHSDVFALPGAEIPSEEVLRDRCIDLAERVPCFECRLGLQAYENDDSGRRLLDRVVGELPRA